MIPFGWEPRGSLGKSWSEVQMRDKEVPKVSMNMPLTPPEGGLTQGMLWVSLPLPQAVAAVCQGHPTESC